jgi:hypothetical protein
LPRRQTARRVLLRLLRVELRQILLVVGLGLLRPRHLLQPLQLVLHQLPPLLQLLALLLPRGVGQALEPVVLDLLQHLWPAAPPRADGARRQLASVREHSCVSSL